MQSISSLHISLVVDRQATIAKQKRSYNKESFVLKEQILCNLLFWCISNIKLKIFHIFFDFLFLHLWPLPLPFLTSSQPCPTRTSFVPRRLTLKALGQASRHPLRFPSKFSQQCSWQVRVLTIYFRFLLFCSELSINWYLIEMFIIQLIKVLNRIFRNLTCLKNNIGEKTGIEVTEIGNCG